MFNGAINGERFGAYVEQLLVPSSSPTTLSSWTILPKGCRCGPLRAAGATLRLLPTTSPDLNPIEQVFAKIKALLRGRAMRTVEALWNALV